MTHSAMIRPAWTPATIALMVLGFMVFWPLGLAMLAYILWGDRFDTFRSDAQSSGKAFFRSCRRGAPRRYQASTGNAAFDEWRDVEIERLNEERRKLDEMRKEFDDYMRDLRMARDREEFDRFMARREDDKNRKAEGGSEIEG